MTFRKDRFRTDPSIALDMAYRVGENHCSESEDGDPNHSSKEHVVSYNIWVDDGEITKAEEQDTYSVDGVSLKEQKDAVRRYGDYEDWPSYLAEKCGEPPFPDRRVFIRYGGGPHIFITVFFDGWLNEPETASVHESKTRTFVPMAYRGDCLCYERISKPRLIEWFDEFVPGDGNDILGEKDVHFVTNGRGAEKLKHRTSRYLLTLPSPNADPDSRLTREAVFEPFYISGLLGVTHKYGRVLCDELVREEKWPVTRLYPPDDNTWFEYDGYVVALEQYWGECDEYDYSTYKFRSAGKLTSEPIVIV